MAHSTRFKPEKLPKIHNSNRWSFPVPLINFSLVPLVCHTALTAGKQISMPELSRVHTSSWTSPTFTHSLREEGAIRVHSPRPSNYYAYSKISLASSS